MLIQRFEPQGRHFTNFHYYYTIFWQRVVRQWKLQPPLAQQKLTIVGSVCGVNSSPQQVVGEGVEVGGDGVVALVVEPHSRHRGAGVAAD